MTPAQREAAARLVGDRIDDLARQVVMLRRLRDSVSHPDSGVPVCAVLGGLTDARDPCDVQLCWYEDGGGD